VFGPDFALDSHDLVLALSKGNYNSDFVEEVEDAAKRFNLVLSGYHADRLVLKAKVDIFTQVGQVQMREAAKAKVPADLLVTTSMLPIVTSAQIFPRKAADLQPSHKQPLIAVLRKQIERLFESLNGYQPSQNQIVEDFNSQLLQTMIVHLGALAHLAQQQKGENDPYQLKAIIHGLLVKLPDLNCKSEEQQAQFAKLTQLVFQLMCQLGEQSMNPQAV
jgi:hypothetical protein